MEKRIMFTKNLKIELTYDPTILVLENYLHNHVNSNIIHSTQKMKATHVITYRS